MKIVAIVGSIRKDSYNMQIAKTMVERYKEKLNIEIADIRSLPYFDQDEELNPPQSVNKPVMTLGATPGQMGTIRAQLHLREILVAPGIQARVLPPSGNEVLINLVNQKVDESKGELVDETTLNFLDSKINTFIDFIK